MFLKGQKRVKHNIPLGINLLYKLICILLQNAHNILALFCKFLQRLFGNIVIPYSFKYYLGSGETTCIFIHYFFFFSQVRRINEKIYAINPFNFKIKVNHYCLSVNITNKTKYEKIPLESVVRNRLAIHV